MSEHIGLAPSHWVQDCLYSLRWTGDEPSRAIDVACGSGRHARLMHAQGFAVTAVDRDQEALSRINPPIQTLALDLEAQGPWGLAGQHYDLVLVTNYLWRPRFDDLLALVAPGGVLIYETFMMGNEQFGSPKNPDFLLEPHELLERCQPALQVARFEQGQRDVPARAMVQRIMAIHKPVAELQSRFCISLK